MVRAWYMDSSPEDHRLQHRPEGSEEVPIDLLRSLGVLYWQLSGDVQDSVLEDVKLSRGYDYEDLITVSPEKLENYETKIKHFFEEHLHSDEEVRYILDGSGYFDVRDAHDRWIRIEVEKGDMITLPAGMYHRFTLDTKNYIKAMRLFKGMPVWNPINRPADSHSARVQYLARPTGGSYLQAQE